MAAAEHGSRLCRFIDEGATKQMRQRLILGWERVLIATRWLQVPLLIGLAIALIIFEFTYFREVVSAVSGIATLGRLHAILLVLDLIDMVLIANLVVMVMISGYEIFVDRFNEQPGETLPYWIGSSRSPGELEIKIATTIMLISAIHLLHAFLDPEEANTPQQLIEILSLHAAFVITAFVFVLIERLSPHVSNARPARPPGPEG